MFLRSVLSLCVAFLAVSLFSHFVNFAPFVHSAYGQPYNSSIELPIEVRLDALESALNAKVPQRLGSIHDQSSRLCVPAKWLKTKVPEFRGLKIYSRTLKTKITPDIYCRLSGFADKNGLIRLQTQNNGLNIRFPVRAQVTAKAIGGAVQETAKARAEFFTNIHANLKPDWTVTGSINQSGHRWQQRPQIRLFRLIKITFASKVDPIIKEKLSHLNQQLPDLLKQVKLKDEMEKIWEKMQKTHQISSNPDFYLHFQPKQIYWSNPVYTDKSVLFKIALNGNSIITSDSNRQSPIVPLPDLVIKPNPLQKKVGQLSLDLPLFASYRALEGGIRKALNKKNVYSLGKERSLTLKGFNISGEKGGNLILKANFDYQSGDAWYCVFRFCKASGDVTFKSTPYLEGGQIKVKDFNFSTSTNQKIADLFINAVNRSGIQAWISPYITYDFSKEIEKVKREANTKLANLPADPVKVNASMDAFTPHALVVDEKGIGVMVDIQGKIGLSVVHLKMD